jgi:hypothetical protein
VIPGQGEVAVVARQLDAPVGLGAVSDEVSEAPDLLDRRVLDVGQHRLEGGEIPVDV